MRRAAVLAATGAAVAPPFLGWGPLPTPSSGLNSPGARVATRASLRAAASRYHRRRRHRPGCGALCAQAGALQGGGGACQAFASSSESADASRTLTLSSPFNPGNAQGVAPRDLLLAAIATHGGLSTTVEPPGGWTAVPTADNANDANVRIRVYYRIAGPSEPDSYRFTLSAPQDAVGGLTDFTGGASQPVDASAGEANPGGSTAVTAPSISPTSPNTLLVFVGATNGAATWAAPPGMRLRYSLASRGQSRTSMGMATELWPTAAATGIRAASISQPLESVGDLIALSYPAPVACPRVQVLSHRVRVTADGLAFVRLRCRWTVACRGAFSGFPFPPVRIGLGDRLVASDFTVGAGQTRTVPLALTRRGRQALARRRTAGTWTWVWVTTPSGQGVVAGGYGGHVILQRR